MQTETVRFDKHAVDHQQHIGLITLNSPKTLNAISLEMVDALYEGLRAWERDDSIVCIILRGSGDRAFCAGGDIQAMYRAMVENPGGACPYTERFFFHEYRLDYLIHCYPKPVIVWGNGIVMGGGLGLFAGGDVRVVTESSRIAMPEITIALYPDVGASYFLNNMPGQCGRFLALTGTSINSGDCVYLGLANAFVKHDMFNEVLSALGRQSWSTSKTSNLTLIRNALEPFVATSSDLLPESNVRNHRQLIDDLFAEKDIHELIDNFLDYKTEDKWLLKAQKTLASGSPLSALLINQQLERCKGKTLAEVFKAELLLSTNITRFTEFAEGIRALLIDKDNAPNWHFKHHRDVPDNVIDSFFVPPWETNPLDTLEE